MGNCLTKSKSKSDPPKAAVRLHGPSGDFGTAYIRFALLHKSVPLQFVPSPESLLQVGPDTVSGSLEAMIRYVDARFPRPPLPPAGVAGPAIVTVAALQHRSLNSHLERLVRWAAQLEARGGRRALHVGTPRMEANKLARTYSQLLELMLEHAQMEERLIFPILQRADPGLCKTANEEHARDLPIMNGIKEDIKSIGVLDYASASYQEALSTLLTRLKSLQGNCKEHFEEEEKEVLPLLQAAELTKEQEERVMEECMAVMQGTHSHLLHFLMEGLLPREAMWYLDLFITCNNKEIAGSMLCTVVK